MGGCTNMENDPGPPTRHGREYGPDPPTIEEEYAALSEVVV